MGLFDRWFNRTIDLNADSQPFWRGFFGGETPSGEPVTFDRAMRLDAVWACINLISNAVGQLPCTVYKEDGVTPAEGDDLYDLLRYLPNIDDTATEFWTMVALCLCLDGNFFAEIKRSGERIVALNPLHPLAVQVRRDPDKGYARYYEYTQRFFEQKPVGVRRIEEKDMFHVRGMIIPEVDRGLSPIAFERNSIGNAIAGEKSAGRMFKSGLISTTFLTSDQILKPEQRKQIEDTLKQFAGAEKAGGVTVLEAGLSPHALTIKPVDAQMLEARQYSVEQICRIFGVPPVMIGHAANGTTTWGSGIEQLILQFYKSCLLPMVGRIESTICRDLLTPAQRKTRTVKFNFDAYLEGDSAARSTFLTKMVSGGIYTINEARAYENKPRIDGGDKIIVNGTMTPLDKLGEAPVAPEVQPSAANTNEKPVPAAPKKAA
jgi:HK97 family phage portal protein